MNQGEINNPNIVRDINAHVKNVWENTKGGIPVVNVGNRDTLNMSEVRLQSTSETPDYSSIVKEMMALGYVEKVKIDGTHNFLIGSTFALDPHTYLHLPATDVVSSFNLSQNAAKVPRGLSSENGLIGTIQPKDPSMPIRLPLHFVTWCFVEDTTNPSEPSHSPIDALSFYADCERKLVDMNCDPANIPEASAQAQGKMIEFTLRNREVIANLYNEFILPKVVKIVLEFTESNPDLITLPANTPGELYLRDLLRCNPGNQRGYCCIGNSSREEMSQYDTGRGPASMFPYHSFTRYVPLDRFAMLFGDKDPHLSPDNIVHFQKLMSLIGEEALDLNSGSGLVNITDLNKISSENLATLIKTIDPYSDYLATYSIPVLSGILKSVFADCPTPNIQISENDHMAAATMLTSDHGRSLKMVVVDKNDLYDSAENDVEFGGRVMKNIYPYLQKFLNIYKNAYEGIFDLMVNGQYDRNTIAECLNNNVGKFEPNPDHLNSLISALLQLKPTAKMEDKQMVDDEQSLNEMRQSRRLEILKGQIIRAVLELMGDEDFKRGILASGGSIPSLLEFAGNEKQKIIARIVINYKENGQYLDNVWNEAFEDIFKTCFEFGTNDENIDLVKVQRQTTAGLALARRGSKAGFRTQNLPKVPGLLLSYRVNRNTVGERQMEIELGFSLGERGAFEIVTGAMLVRLVDLPKTI